MKVMTYLLRDSKGSADKSSGQRLCRKLAATGEDSYSIVASISEDAFVQLAFWEKTYQF